MPCQSDYMEPTRAEQNSKKTAELLLYVMSAISKWGHPKIHTTFVQATVAASDEYGRPGRLEQFTQDLCILISAMDENMRDEVVYNGKSKESRRLADWWDEHKEADRKRILAEAEESNRNSLRQSAMSKLTSEERRALGLK